MSKIQADTITNLADNGAPDFPNGLSTDGTNSFMYEEETGSYTAGSSTITWEATRVGKQVTVLFKATAIDTGTSTANSAAAEISTNFRPARRTGNFVRVQGSAIIAAVSVDSAGTLRMTGTSPTNLNNLNNFDAAFTAVGLSVTYLVD